MRKIKLHHFIPGEGTGIRHPHGDGDGAVGGHLGRAYFRVRVAEGRETQTVPERIERRLGEVAVSPAGHRVVAKRRELDDGLIKSYRQPSGRIVIAGKDIGYGGGTLPAPVPSLQGNGGGVLCPNYRPGAFAPEDHPERVS